MGKVDTFNSTESEQTWTVPSQITVVQIRCYGAAGGDGSATDEGGIADNLIDSPGDPGGFAEGRLSVTAGNTLYVYVGEFGSTAPPREGGWPNGGPGESLNYSDSLGRIDIDSGNGGGSSDVRQGGNTLADRVIVAGGGGGGSAVGEQDSNVSDQNIDTGAGGAGGGTAEDGEDGNPSSGTVLASGGTGGGASGDTGGGGQASRTTADGIMAASGAGGGGKKGGTGGQAATEFEDSGAAAGGGGGDGYIGGVSSASMTTAGGSSGHGSIEIEYADKVGDLTASQGTNADEVDLSWSDTSGESGHNIYRAQTTGSTLADYTQIDSVGSGVTSYTDTTREHGEKYFYRLETTYTNFDDVRSNEGSHIVELPKATINSISETGTNELTIDWNKNDNSSDGSWEIYRSTTEGSLGSQVYSSTTLSTTSYADSIPDSSDTYYYTVRRVTDHTQSDSNQQAAGILAPPSNQATSVSADDVTVTWTDNASNEDGYRVYWRRSTSSTWDNVSSDLAANTESHTVTGLLDGEEYEFIVEVFVGSTTKRPLKEV